MEIQILLSRPVSIFFTETGVIWEYFLSTKKEVKRINDIKKNAIHC